MHGQAVVEQECQTPPPWKHGAETCYGGAGDMRRCGRSQCDLVMGNLCLVPCVESLLDIVVVSQVGDSTR